MKILQVYNQRDVWGGEDFMVDATVSTLRDHGESVDLWVVKNSDHLKGLNGKVIAFFSGIYSFSKKREMHKRLRLDKPDIVHVHNLYPLMSASLLVACREANIPVVVHCHNYFLTCPIGTHLRDGKICERCTNGTTIGCVSNNCRQNMVQSIAYAVRAQITRWRGWFHKDVTRIISLTNFSKNRLLSLNYRQENLVVLPNVVNVPASQSEIHGNKNYVVYAGRISSGKGVSLLIDAAARLPEIEFRIAGEGPLRAELEELATQNVVFKGWLDKDQLTRLYHGARFAVVPSIGYETFCLAAADAMIHGLPVIASKLGGLGEVVDDNLTGLLFETGDVTNLVEKINLLWSDKKLTQEMGSAAYAKAYQDYRQTTYYTKLMRIYRSAIDQINETNP